MPKIRTTKEKEKYLLKRGWSTWYSSDYWINPKVVQDPTSQDYTYYGMALEMAYRFEIEKWPKFAKWGLPQLSQLQHSRQVLNRKTKTKAPIKHE